MTTRVVQLSSLLVGLEPISFVVWGSNPQTTTNQRFPERHKTGVILTLSKGTQKRKAHLSGPRNIPVDGMKSIPAPEKPRNPDSLEHTHTGFPWFHSVRPTRGESKRSEKP